jgi:recombination protein RecT
MIKMITTAKNLPATKPASAQDALMVVFKQDLAKIVPYLETLLPKGGVARFQQMTNLAILRNQELLKCTKISLLLAILWCAQKNLEPGVEDGAWLIPYKGKVVPIPAYKGLITRAVDIGAVTSVDPFTVYEHDEFYYCYGLEPDIRHVPPQLGEDRGELKGAYVIITLPNGSKKFHVMDRQAMEKIRGASAAWKAGESGPWADWEDAMFKKTVIKQGLKTVPMRSEMRDLLAEDTMIEAGSTLGAIMAGAGGDIPPGLEGPDVDPEEKGPDTTVFDALVAEQMAGLTTLEVQTRMTHLQENIKITAKGFKKTIPMFKEYVASNQYFYPYVNPKGESKIGFWKTFLKWEATNYLPLEDSAGTGQGQQESEAGQGEGDPRQVDEESPFEEAGAAKQVEEGTAALQLEDHRKAVIRKILEKAIPLADLELNRLDEITAENILDIEARVMAWKPKKGKK